MLSNDSDYLMLRSGSFSSRICQESVIFASLFVTYSGFILLGILGISKPFQELLFNDSIDCINKRFAVTGCPWGPRSHRSTIDGCDGSSSHESSETKITNIRENENNR